MIQTRQIIEAAIKSDPTATPEQKKRVLDALKDRPQNARPKLITRKQAAELLDCCVMTVKRMEKRGHLTPVRFSARRVRLNEAEVLSVSCSGIQTLEASNV